MCNSRAAGGGTTKCGDSTYLINNKFTPNRIQYRRNGLGKEGVCLSLTEQGGQHVGNDRGAAGWG